ncbi:MAG: patatin-like phospholipase family protein [Bacteroidales bacterium]|jgi:NTE family protein|nr:patatin-like phospholipase family protein [Bacteroidales bacterium]
MKASVLFGILCVCASLYTGPVAGKETSRGNDPGAGPEPQQRSSPEPQQRSSPEPQQRSSPEPQQRSGLQRRTARKKVGLVLSGGGAKGVAHIGVLKVMEEAGIPIDYIAGTSMGAIVGGMYAIGYSPAAMDSIMRAQNWMELLSDKITRDKLFFTEKEVSDKSLITIPYDKDRFYISTGFLSGGSVMDMLSEYTIGYHSMETFDDLPIPFACIAYDLITGDEVVMREGSLPLAIRASMSIPGAFTTVEREGRVLIDGGVINNFPADVVKQMGAEIIIGVDVSMMTEKRENLKRGEIRDDDKNSLMFIVNHMMERMGREIFEKNKGMTDLYIHPDTHPYTTASFNTTAVDSLLIRGERIARENWDALLAVKELIGIHPADDIKMPPNRPGGSHIPVGDSIKLGYIFFDGITMLNENNLRRMLRFKEFSTIDVATLREAVDRFKGTGSFSSLTYSLIGEGSRFNLTFHCRERSRSALSVGIRFDTREIASGYINAVFAPRDLNGGMVELTGRLSTNPFMNIGIFYQDAWLGKFGLSYTYRYGNMELYTSRDTTSHNVRFHKNRFNLDVANFYYRNFNFYLGARYENFRSQSFLMANQASLQKQNLKENLISYRGGVRYDSFDNAHYPGNGVQFKAEYALYTDNMATYKDGIPFSAFSASLFVAVPVAHRVTLVPALYGRFLYGEQFAFPMQNFVGGNIGGHYLDHQLPFYGFLPTEVVDNKFLATGLEARYRMGNNHYVWVKGNVARISRSTLELIEWKKGMYMLGAAAGYSYDSPLGPIDIMVEYGLHPGAKFGVYVNLGKYF